MRDITSLISDEVIIKERSHKQSELMDSRANKYKVRDEERKISEKQNDDDEDESKHEFDKEGVD